MLLLTLFLLLLTPTPAFSHANSSERRYTRAELAELGLEQLADSDPSLVDDHPHTLSELLTTWAWDPAILVPLTLSALLYAVGLRRLWRATHTGAAVSRGEAFCYTAGSFSLFLALVSPLHPWGESLFSAHMVQHEILMLVAAPLLVLGRPLLPVLWSLPAPWRRSLARAASARPWQSTWGALTNAFVAWLAHGLILWAWHIPSWFQATLASDFIHALQHLSFFGSALLFWWAVIHGRRRALGYGMAVLYMFTTALHSGALGALLTFAGSVWYPAYAETAPAWGLTPLEDQQLGGLIMWIPAGIVYIVAGLALFAGWLRESEKRGAGSLSPVPALIPLPVTEDHP